jgi:uncharacterized protein (TIGR03067 family)
MKLPRPVIALVCYVATFLAKAGEEPTAKLKGAVNQPTAAELQPLQGTWEGAAVGESSHQRITITISSNSLHFHRDSDFWFETTFTLPAGTAPRQLHATIKGCPPSQASSIGQVVGAIFKVEEGILTLATGGDGAGEPPTPKSFEATENKGLTRFELRKAQPQRKDTPSKAK